uniref:Uncharacterized protein n=1 Tax=Hyaloperonospora arabidopsidis (strain Emoy2) TaxID=559515 RepID=M4BM13_HYAAE
MDIWVKKWCCQPGRDGRGEWGVMMSRGCGDLGDINSAWKMTAGGENQDRVQKGHGVDPSFSGIMGLGGSGAA